jgi:pilus assembly protein CpaB
MKNLKAVVLIIVALAMGIAAAAYATGWVSRQAVSSNKVVVAAVDVELGTRLNSQMLTTTDWPSGSMPPGAFLDLKLLEGRTVKTSIGRGEPLLERKLAPVGTQGGLSAVIAEGKRAMTVRVNDVVGVAGFALPGTFVDVMVNAQQDGGANEGKIISKTVLEKVLVLAVAQEASRDDTKPKVVSAVTLELTPSEGTLSLVLRNQIDKETVVTKGVTKAELFGAPAPAPVMQKVAAAQRPVVRARPAVVSRSQCVEVVQDGARVLSCF